jgi:hypothetical protein
MANFKPGDQVLIKSIGRVARVDRVDRAGAEVSWVEDKGPNEKRGIRLSGRFSYKALSMVEKAAKKNGL